jgi:hypothetical protein
MMDTPVFFVFDYEQDLCRAQLVRKAWENQGGKALGCWDAASWTKTKGDGQHFRWIDEMVAAASVTVVLVSEVTSQQEYVRYAVRRSHHAQKGLLAVRIHKIPDDIGRTTAIGNARFGAIGRDANNEHLFFWQLYPTYRWVIDDGPRNLKRWIDAASAAAQRKTRA